MTVKVAEGHALFQRVVSVVKMASVLEECRQKEQTDPMQGIFVKKRFLFTVEIVCSVKRFTTGSRNSLKDVRKSQMMPDQVALLGFKK
jgi:hypothetical protein